jgi:hypothetical protein
LNSVDSIYNSSYKDFSLSLRMIYLNVEKVIGLETLCDTYIYIYRRKSGRMCVMHMAIGGGKLVVEGALLRLG